MKNKAKDGKICDKKSAKDPQWVKPAESQQQCNNGSFDDKRPKSHDAERNE